MTAQEVWEVAQQRFYDWRQQTFNGTPAFVDDRAVVDLPGEKLVVIQRADLFGLDATERWAQFVDDRPSWINVSFILDEGGIALFSLARSSGSPEPWYDGPPSVNVSGPSTWSVELR